MRPGRVNNHILRRAQWSRQFSVRAQDAMRAARSAASNPGISRPPLPRSALCKRISVTYDDAATIVEPAAVVVRETVDASEPRRGTYAHLLCRWRRRTCIRAAARDDFPPPQVERARICIRRGYSLATL